MQTDDKQTAQAIQWVDSVLENVRPLHTDVLVLGAGLAGLRAAVRAKSLGRDVVMAYAGRGASPFIIGCNAPFGHAEPADTPMQYAQDVMAGGYGLSDTALVQALCDGATRGVRELAALGVNIARNGERFAQRQLSGNWYARSVFHPAGLGAEALSTLATHAKQLGVVALPGHRALKLLLSGERVCGALLREQRTGEWRPVLASAVVMALGGLGQLYEDSTYPADITSSAYALGYDAGAPLVDMEFVQFEPFVTFKPEALRGLELPTSMLAEGAQLLNSAGERFMFRHNPSWGERRVEKAKLSLCIQQEIDEGRGLDGGVLYDASRVPAATVEGYVRHCRRLRKAGVDPAKLRIPVRPAAHSQMGGLWIDATGCTPVQGLFAAGEAAGGLHGASRIAGNGATDALVFGDLAGASAAALPVPPPHDWRTAVREALGTLGAIGSEHGTLNADDVRAQVRGLMSRHVGLYRTAASLQTTLQELGAMTERFKCDARVASDAERAEAFATLGMARVGQAVTAAALARTESRGAHQRRDHPQTDDAAWRVHVVVQEEAGAGMSVATRPLR